MNSLQPNPNAGKIKCKYCMELINKTAKVCFHCSKYQKKYLNHIASVPIIISIGFLIVSILQFSLVRNERSDAKDSLENAKRAEEKANQALGKALDIEKNVKEMGIKFAEGMITSTELMKTVYESTYTWHDSENKDITKSMDNLISEMKKMSKTFNEE